MALVDPWHSKAAATGLLTPVFRTNSQWAVRPQRTVFFWAMAPLWVLGKLLRLRSCVPAVVRRYAIAAHITHDVRRMRRQIERHGSTGSRYPALTSSLDLDTASDDMVPYRVELLEEARSPERAHWQGAQYAWTPQADEFLAQLRAELEARGIGRWLTTTEL